MCQETRPEASAKPAGRALREAPPERPFPRLRAASAVDARAHVNGRKACQTVGLPQRPSLSVCFGMLRFAKCLSALRGGVVVGRKSTERRGNSISWLTRALTRRSPGRVNLM